MKRSGIPASITLAQGMLESQYGNSMLAKKANNHFGIKCHSWKGRKVYMDDDKRHECFRKYGSVYESYKDHSNFIMNSPRYDFLFGYHRTDYKSWAKGLKKAGYATNPKYDDLLIDLIEKHELYKLDRGITVYSDKETPEPGQGHTIHIRNRVKYVVAKEGDTYKSLAQELKMMPWEIYRYNDLPKDASITPGQVIYTQPKRNKSEHGYDFHIVVNGETMYTIAQKYGIRLEKLYKRNKMKPGEPLNEGQKLWLRKNKQPEENDFIDFQPD